MKCPFCKQHPASVILLQPQDDQILEMALCEFCAQKQNLFEGACLSVQALANRLERGESPVTGENGPPAAGAKGAAGKPPPGDHPKPLVVAESLADKLKIFQKTGRLTGAEDYDALETQLTMLFRKIQGGARHKGKVPRVLQAVRASKDHLSELEERLAAAVAAESYEKAAELRDEIKRLRALPSAETAADEPPGDEAPPADDATPPPAS